MTKPAAQFVMLRPHAESDKEAFVAVSRDPEFYRLLGYELPSGLSREDEADIWYEKKTDPKYSWAIEAEGRCVGSVWLHSLEPDNRRARFAIEIFDSGYWGRGVGSVATKTVIKFAFEDLRLHRLDLRVLTINERAIRCYESCGFTREGVQRETLINGGVWYSDLWMSILDSEYPRRCASGTRAGEIGPNQPVETTETAARPPRLT